MSNLESACGATPDQQDTLRVVVVQLGARMHYAVPRIFASRGELVRLFTDFHAPASLDAKNLPLISRVSWLRRASGRRSGISPALITSFPLFAISYALRLSRARSAAARSRGYLWGSEVICRKVLRHLPRDFNVLYAFNTAASELFSDRAVNDKLKLLEQTIAPKSVEFEILERASREYPRWAAQELRDPNWRALAAREQDEWSRADRIICPSQFVIDSIQAAGGPTEKCVVVPYGIDPPATQQSHEHEGALRVLFVGALTLRKGVPYAFDAARMLGSNAVFRFVGPVTEAVRDVSIPSSCEIVGSVPRSDVKEHMRWADVLLLPSLCEGSATVTYEALAAGLPVVCTSNSGSVVDDRVNGIYVDVMSAKSIHDALMELADPRVRGEMAAQAKRTATRYTVERYGERLHSVVEDSFRRRKSS